MDQALVKSIHRSHTSVRNRLYSIAHDAEWVAEVADAYALPLIPNERCGLWYADPQNVDETCYFKSTDGHTTQWSFSHRRLNFHLLDLIQARGGVLIVDSTRRGKTMPDALSKTIPIWCAVLNYIKEGTAENNWFMWPRQTVSSNEAQSIIDLIPSLAQRVMELNIITKETLQEKLGDKYLRPLWAYPGMSLPMDPPEFEDFYPVVCCVASERQDDGVKKMNGYVYVQGAADDHELWAKELNHELFWQNKETLLNPELGDEEILNLIDTLELKRSGETMEDVTVLVPEISVGKITGDLTKDDCGKYDQVLVVSENFKAIDSPKVKVYPIGCNKKGSNELRKNLPDILSWITGNVLILCDTGTDISIGVALSLLVSRYDLKWSKTSSTMVTKDLIKKQLAKILEKKKVNPSRATLQAINACLM